MTPEDRVAAAIDAVPQLAGAHNVQRLGGLTNVNFKVESSAGTFVVRIDASDGDALDIDRESELANCQAASDAGVGAPFVSWLPAEHVLIMGFLTGRTLTPDDLRRGDRLAEVAALLRRLHSSCRFRGNFDMFRRQRDYQAAALGRGFAVPDGYVRHERDVRRIDRAFAAHPMPPLACHNDLVAENFIDTPQALRLVDYDYSGNDLGDAWSESHLSLAQLEQLVACYYGEPDPALVARARLWALMSKYGWTLWAVLRHNVAPDPDLMAWGQGLYDEAAAEFDADEFERLPEDAAAPPHPSCRST
ncbi:MAG: phosphotransferase [Actinomycetota bacterium]|nr:phosphotransferase [Actinomycetota bacterium]